MNKYNNGKIYKIVDNTNGNVYIGKTKQSLKERLRKHKYFKDCSSREILKNEDYKIELIEETDDESIERYWIENSECINQRIPGRTMKEYQKDNRKKILQYQSEYRENNKDKTKAKAKPKENNFSFRFMGESRIDNDEETRAFAEGNASFSAPKPSSIESETESES